MKTIFLSYIILVGMFTTTIANAQQDTLRPFSVFIRLNTLSPLSSTYPTIQPSIGGKYKRVTGMYTYAPAINTFIGTDFFSDNPHYIMSYKGHKQKLEFRYYEKIRNRNAKVNRYVALELFKNTFEKERIKGTFDDVEKKYRYSYDYAKHSVKTQGVGIKGGARLFLTKALFLEYAVGINMGSRKVRYTDIVNLQKYDYRRHYFALDYTDEVEGTSPDGFPVLELALSYKLF